MPDRARRGLLVLGLVASGAVMVGPGLLPGRTVLPLDVVAHYAPWRGSRPAPANPLHGDPVLQFASRPLAARALDRGTVPLWDPGSMAGHPLAGDPQASPLSPLQLALLAAFAPLRAASWQALAHALIAGFGTAWWLRELGARRAAALVAGLAFMLSGHAQVWKAYPAFSGTTAWLPWCAAAWLRAVRTGRLAPAAWGGLAAGMALLAGQIQHALFGAVVLAVHVVGGVVALPAARRRHALAAAAAVGGIGALVGALGVLPALDVARETIRPPFTPDALRETAVPPRQLIALVAPWFLGDPRLGTYRGAQNANEMALYLGILPLLLALAAPWLRRDAATRSLAAAGLLVAAIALGTPAAAPLSALPMVQRFGLMRWLAVVPLAVAPLAGLAVDAAMSDARAARALARWLAGGAAGAAAVVAAAALAEPAGRPGAAMALAWLAVGAAAGVAFARRPASPARQALLAAAVAADLVAFGWGYTPAGRIDDPFADRAPLPRLSAERAAAPFRVALAQNERIALGPGLAPLVGLDDIGGYSSSVRASYRAFLGPFATPPGEGHIAANPNMVAFGALDPLLLRLLDVRYVLSASPLPPFDRPLDAAAACAETAVVGEGAPVAGAVVAWADGLNRLDVGVVEGGPVAVHLVVRPGDARHLAYGELAPTGDGPVRSLYLEPIRPSAGRLLHAYVDVPPGGGTARVCAPGGRLALGLGATDPPLALDEATNGLWVYRAPPPFGAAWWVSRAERAPDAAEAARRVAERAVDPARVVVLEGPTDSGDAAAPSAPGAAPAVRVDERGPNARAFGLSPPIAGGWLVVSQAHADGWRATADGRPARVERAYGGLTAVALPAKRAVSRIELRYRPANVSWGLASAAAGLVIAALLTGGAAWARRRPRARWPRVPASRRSA